MDPESRRLLESGYRLSGYGSGGYGAEGHRPEDYGPQGYGRGFAGPGYGAAGYGGSGYRQPAMEDYGYGDPGYSDPAYDGPRSGYSTPASPGGYRGTRTPGGSPGPDGGHGRVPGYGDSFPSSPSSPSSYLDPGYAEPGDQRQYEDPRTGAVYPVTGAQQDRPATGPQPTAESWAARDAGAAATGSHAYPEQWYGNPRMNDPRASSPHPDVLRSDGARSDGPRSDGPRSDGPRSDGPRSDGLAAADPRLAGMRYDQLRYDDAPLGAPGDDEPLDDESWYEELRRSAPAYPQRRADQPGPGQRAADPNRADPRASGYGQPPGYGQSGYGHQPGYPQAPGPEQNPGYGQSWDDRGGPGPRMSADPGAWPGDISETGDIQRPDLAFPQGLAAQGADYLGAPTAQVGVLTPPAIRRLDDPEDGEPLLAGPGASQLLAPPVRPGHGLDGPEITSSWPSQPSVDDLESFEEFWREDDKDDDYPGLFPPDDADLDRAYDSGTRGGRRVGRRRGRSNDHRLWLALVAVVVVAAAAIFGIIKFEFPSHSGPAHTMVTPAQIGTYTRTVDLERQTNVAQLRDEVIKMSSGQASHVVSAVYESGDSAAGSTEQIIMFIGGHLANAAPATSIASFTQRFTGAKMVSAGSLGGKAACVEEGTGTSDAVSMCAWFDNDSFGEIVSPTMNAASLATVMRTVRPSVELVVPK